MIWVPALGIAFFGYLFDLIRCLDSCGQAPDWWHDPHGWQWTGQFWGLAVPALVVASVTVFLLATRRLRQAYVGLGLTFALALTWVLVLHLYAVALAVAGLVMMGLGGVLVVQNARMRQRPS